MTEISTEEKPSDVILKYWIFRKTKFEFSKDKMIYGLCYLIRMYLFFNKIQSKSQSDQKIKVTLLGPFTINILVNILFNKRKYDFID